MPPTATTTATTSTTTATMDVLTPSPLKLHVRRVRPHGGANATTTATDGPVLYELWCRMTTGPAGQRVPLRLRSPTSDSERHVEWTIWKSFDEFQAFDRQMRDPRVSSFARMMVTVAFAPEHRVRAFFHQDHTTSFLEKRRKELDYYLQRILLLSDIGDFMSGQGSRVLAEFLHAPEHVPCGALSTTSTAESTAISPHTAGGLRQLHVDLRSTYSASSTDDDGQPRSRRYYKQEIEDCLLDRCGPDALKAFKKRASAFRKENDVLVGAADFVSNVHKTYDSELAQWLLVRFYRTLRSADQRSALAAAAGFRDETEHERQSEKIRQSLIDHHQTCAPPAPSTRKRSNKDLLAKIDKITNGNQEQVSAFKRAAKALGKEEMTCEAFVEFLRSTFGERDAHRILKFTADVVPSKRLQVELREAARP